MHIEPESKVKIALMPLGARVMGQSINSIDKRCGWSLGSANIAAVTIHLQQDITSRSYGQQQQQSSVAC